MKDKLQEIWNRQYDFDCLAMGNAGVTRKETLANRQVALMTELGELFNEMQNFKYWKKNKDIKAENIKEEFADVLHFVMSLAIDIYEDTEDMIEWYRYKNNKNVKRQKDNY